AGHPVAALGSHGHAAKDVAPADNHADLDAHGAGFSDIGSDAIGNRDINAKTLAAHERFAGSLEEDALVDGIGRHEGSLKSNCRRKYQTACGYTKGTGLSPGALRF